MPPLVSRRAFVHSAGFTVTSFLGGRVRGADTTPKVPTVSEVLAREVADAPLALKFPGGSADDCRKWQTAFGQKLRELLGPHTPPRTWQTRARKVTELPDHVREELLLGAEGHPPLPVYLLLPRPKGKGRVPGVIALHGHGEYGYHTVAGRDDLPGVEKAIAAANYDYGRQLVRRGYAVAVPCFTPFGDRLGKFGSVGKQDACAETFVRMQALGKVLMAENLRDALWSLELLASHAEVDAERLGCAGLSLGGRMTTLTAAVEPRIKVALIAGALNVMQERLSKPFGCGAQIIPGMLRYGDVPEIASLIAPRPCLWTVGSSDKLLPEKWQEEALARQRRAYDAFGAADKLKVDRFDGGHRWNGTVAFPLLDGVLKG